MQPQGTKVWPHTHSHNRTQFWTHALKATIQDFGNTNKNIVHLTNIKIKKLKVSKLGPTAELARNCT